VHLLVYYISVNIKNYIYVFVQCIVIQLCNVNQQNALLNYVSIQIFLPSTSFEHLTFIIRKTTLCMQPYVVCYSCVYVSSLAGGRMCSINKRKITSYLTRISFQHLPPKLCYLSTKLHVAAFQSTVV